MADSQDSVTPTVGSNQADALSELLTQALVSGLAKNEYFARNLAKELAKNTKLMASMAGLVNPDVVGEALAKEILNRAHAGSVIANDVVRFIRIQAGNKASDMLAERVAEEVMHS